MARTLFANGRILPCIARGETPFDGDILVEGQRIAEVAHGRIAVSDDVRVIDLRGATVMPGLGDAHVHFGQPLDFEFDYGAAAFADPEEAALSTAAVARRYIEHGVTICVSGGIAQPRGDVALKAVIEKGWVEGPRILAGGSMISDPAGIPAAVMPTSATAMREAVKTQCGIGVEVIKLFLSGENVLPPGMEKVPIELTFLGDELVGAAVEEAGRHGAFVHVHARGAGSVNLAARRGVRLISHASHVDDEALRLLSDRDDVWVCPGLHYLWTMPNLADEPYRTMAIEGGYDREYEDAVASMRRLHDAGVPVLPGGDYGHVWIPHGGVAHDLKHLTQRCGIATDEALLLATRAFGDLTGLPVGRLEPGLFADLLVVDGDPTADVGVLTDAAQRRAVVKGGRVAWANPDRIARV